MPRAELYIGNLNRDVSRKDIENVFEKYGRLVRCDVKNRGYGSVYAFLEFEDERDAEDALRAENGKDMCGSSMLVEFAKNKNGRGDRERYRDRNGFGRGGRGGASRSLECYECGERGHFARDCRNRRSSGRRSDRDRDRSYDRDRDRDRDRRRDDRGGDRRDHGRDRERDRDRDRDRERRHSRSASNHSRSKSRSRSPSYDRGNNRERERSPE